MLLSVFYHFASSEYVYEVQDYTDFSTSYETVKFYTFLDINLDYKIHLVNPLDWTTHVVDLPIFNIPASIYMYWLVISGQKTVSIIINLLLGLTFLMHPYLMPLSVYFLIQLPVDFALVIYVYTLWPEKRVPFAHKWFLHTFFAIEDHDGVEVNTSEQRLKGE